jgi:hypothetical protein
MPWSESLGRWPEIVPTLAGRLDLDWTADMSKGAQKRQALPPIGPRGQAVIDQLLVRVSELKFCEHTPIDFAFWIATRPAMLLCDFCYQAAQVLAEDIQCEACGQPAGDPGKDVIVVGKAAIWLGAHFYFCSLCAELDLRHVRNVG